jgi:hydroxylaminobenzene mutase
MSLRAVLGGVAVGALVGAVLAVALALVVYNTSLPAQFVEVGTWVADAMVSLAAGWAAARRTDSGAALHGILAAVTLAIIGNLAAELSTLPTGSLWGQLGLAAVMGLTGGLIAAVF